MAVSFRSRSRGLPYSRNWLHSAAQRSAPCGQWHWRLRLIWLTDRRGGREREREVLRHPHYPVAHRLQRRETAQLSRGRKREREEGEGAVTDYHWLSPKCLPLKCRSSSLPPNSTRCKPLFDCFKANDNTCHRVDLFFFLLFFRFFVFSNETNSLLLYEYIFYFNFCRVKDRSSVFVNLDVSHSILFFLSSIMPGLTHLHTPQSWRTVLYLAWTCGHWLKKD